MGASLDAIISTDTYVTVTCPITGKLHTFEGPKVLWKLRPIITTRVLRGMDNTSTSSNDLLWVEMGSYCCCYEKMGEPIIYPVPRDPVLIDKIRVKVAEFWDLVDNDGGYPPLAPPSKKCGLNFTAKQNQY